jgi:hypothetical protein
VTFPGKITIDLPPPAPSQMDWVWWVSHGPKCHAGVTVTRTGSAPGKANVLAWTAAADVPESLEGTLSTDGTPTPASGPLGTFKIYRDLEIIADWDGHSAVIPWADVVSDGYVVRASDADGQWAMKFDLTIHWVPGGTW